MPHAVVAAETQNHEAPKGNPGSAWRKAANAVAIRTLLLQEARSRKIAADPQEVGPGRFEIEEEALIRGLLELVIDVTPPEPGDIRSEWEKDPARFRAPPLWEVSHILCACDLRDEAGRTKALVRATGILELALGDPGGFASLAARESDCGSKASGGALGQLGPGDIVPEFEAALRQLAEGEIIAAPVLTRHGYHIIRMDALGEGQVLPFEAVREKIGEALEKTAWARQARQFVDQLVKASRIEGADLNMG
ncbi:peptidylprolyl isomerase [Roseibium marinum]|uniref:peptidylprolyl isomerase n=1 Tax=Roseibium marinum TaxID=281252 RepID=UPI001AD94EDA|nr:peptidylprolyl isomerase [Roseibium marinum]